MSSLEGLLLVVLASRRGKKEILWARPQLAMARTQRDARLTNGGGWGRAGPLMCVCKGLRSFLGNILPRAEPPQFDPATKALHGSYSDYI